MINCTRAVLTVWSTLEFRQLSSLSYTCISEGKLKFSNGFTHSHRFPCMTSVHTQNPHTYIHTSTHMHALLYSQPPYWFEALEGARRYSLDIIFVEISAKCMYGCMYACMYSVYTLVLDPNFVETFAGIHVHEQVRTDQLTASWLTHNCLSAATPWDTRIYICVHTYTHIHTWRLLTHSNLRAVRSSNTRDGIPEIKLRSRYLREPMYVCVYVCIYI